MGTVEIICNEYENKKAQVELHWLVGVLFILGGVSYFFQPNLGGVLVALGVFYLLSFKWFRSLI